MPQSTLTARHIIVWRALLQALEVPFEEQRRIEKNIAEMLQEFETGIETNSSDTSSLRAMIEQLEDGTTVIHGQDGEDATDEMVWNALVTYLDQNPIQHGKDATDEQVASSVASFFSSNPIPQGLPGANATPAQIAFAVADHLSKNPPAPGADATPAQVATAVTNYLRANPPAPGKDGVGVEISNNQGMLQWRSIGSQQWYDITPMSALVGAPGNSVTEQQLVSAINAYFQANPPVEGKSVELQVRDGKIQWKQVGGSWIDLVSLDALRGSPKRIVELSATSGAGGIAAFTFSPPFSSIDTIVVHEGWVGLQRISGQEILADRTNSGTRVQVMQAKVTLSLTAGAFEVATAGRPIRISVFGN